MKVYWDLLKDIAFITLFLPYLTSDIFIMKVIKETVYGEGFSALYKGFISIRSMTNYFLDRHLMKNYAR